MISQTLHSDNITIEGAPNIPGLRFRRFRGESEYAAMIPVVDGSRTADGIDEVSTVEKLARSYANLRNCDPYKDMVMTEVNGQLIGYTRVFWSTELDGTVIYSHFGVLLPEWRGKGIGTALFRHSERRLREIAAEHPDQEKQFLDTGAGNTQPGLISLIEGEGYKPVRYGYSMIRPDLENIPEAPLPQGIEVRPVKSEHLRAIWEAEVEGFKDHWGEWQTEEGDYERWLNRPIFQPDIWQVAWDGDQVVGMVRNFISEAENTRYGRLRGYTEDISVRRAWRKRGVARALIARSFALLKELGMTEAALGVDAENPNGALQLYESMGFKQDKVYTSYRKPLK